jgi:hypothetical protein
MSNCRFDESTPDPLIMVPSLGVFQGSPVPHSKKGLWIGSGQRPSELLDERGQIGQVWCWTSGQAWAGSAASQAWMELEVPG